MMRVVFLGSGSGGNATLVAWGSTRVLVDCGFSAREVARRLALHGEDAADVTAMVVTHEHTDHARGLRVFQKRHATPIHCSEGTAAGALHDRHGPFEHERVRAGAPFTVGELTVLPFRVSHDAREPLGYTFTAPDGSRLGYASDAGVWTPEMADALSGCDLLALESNHDVEMLRRGPYPWHLKRRIASDRGHLSNVAAAEALEALASDRLRHVFAIHVSRTNNTGRLAAEGLRARLNAIGLDVPVTPIGQDDGCAHPPRQSTLF
jgi:phosphoribosyl 1,2-cyclic phosphodiesterase